MSVLPESEFGDLVSDETGGNAKTLQSDYLPAGKFPIVDQGQSLIGGYTNDATRVCKAKLPVVIFGDHTKCFKFIDFPFCLGADGTKVLRPKQPIDGRYLFYALQRIHIPDAGYSRHFKYLKEGKIPLPSLDKQKRIAVILDQAAELRHKRQSVLDHLGQLGQAIFHELFGDPALNQQEFPFFNLEDLVEPQRPITYGILKPGEDTPNGVPYVRVVDIKNDRVRVEALKRTTPEIAKSYRRSALTKGDLLISIRGHVGRMAIAPAECEGANITQDTARLSILKANTVFVKYVLSSPSMRFWMDQRTRGIAVRGINLGDLKKAPIILPPADQQNRFSDIIAEVDQQIVKAEAQMVEANLLFSSIQNRAFRGEL